MSHVTVTQARAYAMQAGFTGASLDTIVAIATAESGLQPDIRGKSDPRDRGILQINSYWHPEVSDAAAFNPATAFQEAFRISQQGTNFSQWNTFKNGAYKQYVGSGSSVSNDNTNTNQSSSSSGSPIPGVDGIAAIAGAFTTLTSPSTWVRVGLFGVAIIFLIIGMMVFASGEMK